MTQHVFICLAFVLLTFSTVFCADDIDHENDNNDYQCEKNIAIKTDCATNCELNKCPVTENYSRICDKEKCTPGCQCLFNQKLAANGTCIPTQHCPPFPCDRPNEEYVSCPSYCSDSCSQSNCQTFGLMLMVVECFPACRCKEEFNRKAGICVPREQC